MAAIRCVILLSALCCISAVHKKMEEMKARDSFVKNSLVPLSDQKHEIVFAVKQRNIDVLDSMLMEMSTPGNPKYQQWLTFQEVGDLTSNPDGASAIRGWLTDSGVSVSWESAHKDYLKATAPISVWESMLNTKFSYWTDTTLVGQKEESKLWVRAEEYSVPDYLEEHLHAVFNTVHPPPVVSKAYHRSKDNTDVKTTLRMRDMMYQQAVTVSFLNSYYGIPSNVGNALQNQSVFETSNEYFSPGDLTTFQTNYHTTLQKAIAVAGFTTETCSVSGTPTDCFEGNLDIQYIMGISQVTSSIYWYVGGNDPFVDYVTDISDMANPPQSNSISWGTIEQQNPVSVMSAFSTETLKLTSQGVTVMVSTGDNGVANFGCTCNNAKATTSSNCACNANSGSSQSSWTGTSWSGKGYFPSFPATCPYVVAVGATMFPATSTRPEIACQSQLSGIITSGGGFSTYYATPSWQTSAVSGYFAGLTTQPSTGYNAKGRGIPDISLLGVNYQVIVRGQAVTLFGTSASAPVFAGMISLINAGRKARGYPNVGFINPTLYEFGLSGTVKTFTDVTSGNNKCCSNGSPGTVPTICCAAGFNSSAGWDPVTGWGSITYTNLETMLDADINPTVQPTFAPTAVPTPTPLPSLNPTFQPTPLAGSPTLAPSVNNVVSAQVTQVILGAGITAITFNDDPSNAFSVQEAVIQSVANVETVAIGTVWDYVAPTGRRQLQVTSGVYVNYTISANNGGSMTSQESYDSITSQITSAVDSGTFTTLMNQYATTNGAALLVTATSDQVSVAAAYSAPTSSPVKSPSTFTSTDAIITAVVLIIVFLLTVGCCVFCYCNKRNSSPAPNQYGSSAHATPVVQAHNVPNPINVHNKF